MEELFKADVFFFITAIAVIVVTILLCIILYHVLKAVKGIRRIIDRVEAGSEILVEDLSQARSKLLNTSIASILSGLMRGFKNKVMPTAPANEPEEEVEADSVDSRMERLIAEKQKRKRAKIMDIKNED